jgi:integrase
VDPDALTVKGLVNKFLYAKECRKNEGRLSPLTWGDYNTATDEIIAAFGKQRLVSDLRPDDFATLRNRMAKKWGFQRLCKTIQFVRCVFRYAFEAELIDRPVRFGPDFKRPSKGEYRIYKAKQGPKVFTAEEVRQLLGYPPWTPLESVPLRAMILLGINCGFGNSDCGNLPISAIDFEKAIIDYPRPKTGIARRAPLWPETVAAIREAIVQRPAPKKEEHAGLVFITRFGDSWHTNTTDGPLSREVGKLLRRLGINGRKGLGFYTLRHTFRTIADRAKDQPAADYIMGHEVAHMSSVYREVIDDERLQDVTDHVRAWLFGPAKE